MTKLPRIKGQELVAALRKAGFEVIRVKGSQHFLRHSDGQNRDRHYLFPYKLEKAA